MWLVTNDRLVRRADRSSATDDVVLSLDAYAAALHGGRPVRRGGRDRA
jgi:hypothetical protein